MAFNIFEERFIEIRTNAYSKFSRYFGFMAVVCLAMALAGLAINDPKVAAASKSNSFLETSQQVTKTTFQAPRVKVDNDNTVFLELKGKRHGKRLSAASAPATSAVQHELAASSNNGVSFLQKGGGDCSPMVLFIYLFAGLCLLQVAVNLVLGFSLYKLSECLLAGVFLSLLGVHFLVILGQMAILALGALWTFGDSMGFCEATYNHFFHNVSLYIMGTGAVLFLQALFGTLFLVLWGLKDAIMDAVALIEEAPSDPTAQPKITDHTPLMSPTANN